MSESNKEVSDLEDYEENLFIEDGFSEITPDDIIAFNELRSCADLFRMHERGQLDIQPDYQRNFVWTNASQARFIDSLVKQLPIPSICISLDYKNDRRQVVDGLQRISTIIRFLTDSRWKLPTLPDIHPDLAGKTVSEITRQSRHLVDRIENTTIPVTVLRCDLSLRPHQEYLFTIFHRLNTGGVSLSNQEIRNCIFSGPLNDMLKSFVGTDLYKSIFPNRKTPYRFIEEEKVLRVLALSQEGSRYTAPLSKFLNSYMSQYREPSDMYLNEIYSRLDRTYSLFFDVISHSDTHHISNTIAEASLVGIYKNLENLNGKDIGTISQAWKELLTEPVFLTENLRQWLSSTDSMNERIEVASRAFAI